MIQRGWFLLSTHALVLIEIVRRPDATMRELATRVGITQRQVARVADDLEDAGYLIRERVGRRNQYVVQMNQPLQPPFAAVRVGGFLAAFA